MRLAPSRYTLVVLALCGCEHADFAGPSTTVDAATLAGVAAQSLDASGHFLLPRHGADPAGEISVDQARRIAAAFARTAFLSAAMLEADRGAPIHWGALAPCPRAYYVESAYSGVPADAPQVLRKQAGSQWLVGLCSGATEEVVVGISALATDVTLSSDSAEFVSVGKGNFMVMGVPVGVEIPTSPEVIANLTAAASHRRVALVPQLVMRALPAAAMIAVWRVGLESDVTVRGDQSHVSRPRRSIFAGPLNGWRYPAFADFVPPADTLPILEPVRYYDRTVILTRKANAPSTLELITFASP